MVHRIKYVMWILVSATLTSEAPAMPVRMQMSHAGKYDPRMSKDGARPHPLIKRVSGTGHVFLTLLDIRIALSPLWLRGLCVYLDHVSRPKGEIRHLQ